MNFNETNERVFAGLKPGRQPINLDQRMTELREKFPFSDRRLTMALPTGELQRSVTDYMRKIGLKFADNDRRYFVEVENMPIDFIFVRASEIPEVVSSPFSPTIVGITGSDIIWEKSKKSEIPKGSGEEIPIFSLVSDSKPSSLYIGFTKSFAEWIEQEKGRAPVVADLTTCRIATKLPNVTRDYLDANGIPLSPKGELLGTKIMKVSGTDEAYQFIYGYEAILGVISSGRTVDANGIEIIDRFYDVTAQMIQYEYSSLWDKGFSTEDLVILDDLRELTYLALQRRGMV